MPRKGLVRPGLSMLLVLALCFVPISLSADPREDHAQDLVKIAEQRLAEGNEEAAYNIAETVISEYSETRAVNKAKEIKKAAESKLGGKGPPTKSKTIKQPWPDPKEAFRRGCYYPGGGQFYLDQDLGGCVCLGGSIAVGIAMIGVPIMISQNSDEFGSDEWVNCIGLDLVFATLESGFWLGGAIVAKRSARKIQEMK